MQILLAWWIPRAAWIRILLRRTCAAAKAESSSPLGYHGHDNLSLAMANTLRAIEEGAVLVDSSLQGMGRSAGNTVTEVLVAILQRRGSMPHIDLKAAMDVGQGLIQPLLGKRGVDPMAVTGGLAKFHSSFTGKVQSYARKHDIDVRDLIVRLCQEDQVSAPDELLERLSHELATLKMPRVLSIPAFRVESGEDKTSAEALDILLKELRARAVKAGKFSALNVVTAEQPLDDFVVSGNIHSTQSHVVGSVDSSERRTSENDSAYHRWQGRCFAARCGPQALRPVEGRRNGSRNSQEDGPAHLSR